MSIIFSFISILFISGLSLLGALTIFIRKRKLDTILKYSISLAAGAMFGDVFVHLLPEISKQTHFSFPIPIIFFVGILLSFIIEKTVCWNHCHDHIHDSKKKEKTFAYMILYGDAVHNMMDGIMIASSFLISTSLGLATTLAVILHEIPHEIGDFGVLLQGGFSRKKALVMNAVSAIPAFFGALIAFVLYTNIQLVTPHLLALTAANFLYIAGSNLVPELHKERDKKNIYIQICVLVLGFVCMIPLLLLEK